MTVVINLAFMTNWINANSSHLSAFHLDTGRGEELRFLMTMARPETLVAQGLAFLHKKRDELVISACTDIFSL